MAIKFHPHARERMTERGATEQDVVTAVETGEEVPAQFGRQGFRRNLPFGAEWRGRHFATKQIEAYAVRDGEDWLVITVIVKYF